MLVGGGRGGGLGDPHMKILRFQFHFVTLSRWRYGQISIYDDSEPNEKMFWKEKSIFWEMPHVKNMLATNNSDWTGSNYL